MRRLCLIVNCFRDQLKCPLIIRLLVVALGILFGLGIYSYGMFHTLLPAWSNFVNVANCGVIKGATYAAVDTTVSGATDLPLCQVEPGRWTITPYGDAPMFFALAMAFLSTMIALHRSTFLRWAISSARGTILLFSIVFGIPMTLLGLHLNFVEGTLTLDWAIHVVLYTLLISAASGLVAWYTMIRRLRNKVATRDQPGKR
jgi:hypothetical protein